eukprot:534164-Rhodomonas_salina.1
MRCACTFARRSRVRPLTLRAQVGIVSANVRSECDPALALMTEKVESDKSTIQRIGASLGLGLAYAGTQREEVLELLTPVIADPETPIDLFSLASLALGLVFVGTGKPDIAETIMQGMMEREEKVMEDTMARFACLVCRAPLLPPPLFKPVALGSPSAALRLYPGFVHVSYTSNSSM